MREIINSRRQSAESKKFYKDRAAAKRERKGRINHARVLRGEMQYSDDHLKRTGAVILGRSEVHLGDRLIGHARRVVMTPSIDILTDSSGLESMTVAELLDYGRSIKAKVTTKMTKAKLIELIRAAG